MPHGACITRSVARYAAGAVLIGGALVAVGRRPPALPVVSIEREGASTLGSSGATVTMVYFTDYDCVPCRAFATQTLQEVRRRFVEQGSLLLIVRDLPVHPGSSGIAAAARCAGEFGKYWAFHDSLFAARDARVTPEVARRVAGHVGVPLDPFDRCVASRRYDDAVRADGVRAAARQINDAPALVIGAASGRRMRGALVLGAPRFALLDSLLRRALQH